MKYYFLIALLLLASCAPAYDVDMSEITFDHDGEIDVISYVVTNPTDKNLACELDINFEGDEGVSDSFEISSQETKNLSTRAKLPFGETKVRLETRCKPTN